MMKIGGGDKGVGDDANRPSSTGIQILEGRTMWRAFVTLRVMDPEWLRTWYLLLVVHKHKQQCEHDSIRMVGQGRTTVVHRTRAVRVPGILLHEYPWIYQSVPLQPYRVVVEGSQSSIVWHITYQGYLAVVLVVLVGTTLSHNIKTACI